MLQSRVVMRTLMELLILQKQKRGRKQMLQSRVVMRTLVELLNQKRERKQMLQSRVVMRAMDQTDGRL
ncbi:hypothetical protein K1719_002071 [Acacia pycnantha]|nr:hypothetical protein K1719_002071 [Acacia pycnantha]